MLALIDRLQHLAHEFASTILKLKPIKLSKCDFLWTDDADLICCFLGELLFLNFAHFLILAHLYF